MSTSAHNNMVENVVDGKPYNTESQSSSNEALEFRSRYPVDPLEPYYDMSGDKLLVIFNHYQYKKTPYFRGRSHTPRDGTAADVKRLRDVFETLGFKVQAHQDLDYEEIMDIVGELCTRKQQRPSCVAVAILTHGSAGGGLSAADRPYNLEDVLQQFLSETLVNVPKLFFIQACRGSKTDSGLIVHDGQSDNAFLVPSHADFLILYGTVEDFVSWRSADGSWMIQELCNVLEEHSGSLDLLAIITIVNRRVALDKMSHNTDAMYHNKKAVPETRFTLTKLLKFH